MKKKNNHKPHTVEEKAKAFFLEQQALLKRHGIAMRLVIAFPRRKRVPFFGRVGMWLVSKSGGIIDTMIKDIN